MISLEIHKTTFFLFTAAVQDPMLHILEFSVSLSASHHEILLGLPRLGISHINLLDESFNLNLVQIVFVLVILQLLLKSLGIRLEAQSLSSSALILTILLLKLHFKFSDLLLVLGLT